MDVFAQERIGSLILPTGAFSNTASSINVTILSLLITVALLSRSFSGHFSVGNGTRGSIVSTHAVG